MKYEVQKRKKNVITQVHDTNEQHNRTRNTKLNDNGCNSIRYTMQNVTELGMLS